MNNLSDAERGGASLTRHTDGAGGRASRSRWDISTPTAPPSGRATRTNRAIVGALFDDMRRRLCGFFGIPPGAALGDAGMTLVV